MDLVSVMLEENPRRVLRRALAARSLRAAIVPTGSTEQHNEHLAMSHDTDSATILSRKVAENLYPSVIVTTPVSVGVSEHWMSHKGTLTLSSETFSQVVYEICQSLARHGFGAILVLNGHAGNHRILSERVPAFAESLGIAMEFCSYWEVYPPQVIAQQLVTKECPGHAAEFETSFAMAAFPENVFFNDEEYPESELEFPDQKQRQDDLRFFSGARLATVEKGNSLLTIAIEELTYRMHRLLNSKQPR